MYSVSSDNTAVTPYTAPVPSIHHTDAIIAIISSRAGEVCP